MSDIFISYARRDRRAAQRLAKALEAHGWSVWWDTRLLPGVLFRHEIERELAGACCVVVLWSKASVQSHWVLEEAQEGLRRDILVPAKIENVPPPLPFGGIQTADLVGWKGSSAHQAFESLKRSVAQVLERSIAQEPEKQDPHQRRVMELDRPVWKRISMAIAVTLLFAMPLVMFLFISWNQPLRNYLSPSALQMRLHPQSPPPVASPVPPSLKFYGNRIGSDLALRLEAAASKRFTMDTKIEVRPYNPTQEMRWPRLIEAMQSQSSEFDAVTIDIIWAGALAPHLIDLRSFFEKEISQHNEILIDANTVEDQLVAIPWYQNIGLLFYRKDLLRKYNLREPRDWKELEETAAKIQVEEKKHDPEFVGFAWQGQRYEGLTCNALEWFASEGALDMNTGLPLFNDEDEGVLDALDRAREWVNGENAISPDAQHHMEEGSVQMFLDRKAAFLRTWSNEYARLKESGIEFGVAPLPRGRAEENFSVLGGWQLAIPKYSLNQRSAIQFIRYLSSPQVQEWRAREGTYQPSIENVDVPEDLLSLKDENFRTIQHIIRPSNRLGDRYDIVSSCIYRSVYSALSKNTRNDIRQDIVEMENCIERASNGAISEGAVDG